MEDGRGRALVRVRARSVAPRSGTAPSKARAHAAIDEYTLRLKAIRFHAHLGVSRDERASRQEVVVDVELVLPVSSLPARDSVRDVVDYDAVTRCVVEVGLAKPHRLLETYVAHVVARLLAATSATKVRVAATKSHVPTTYPVDAAIVELVGHRRPPAPVR